MRALDRDRHWRVWRLRVSWWGLDPWLWPKDVRGPLEVRWVR